MRIAVGGSRSNHIALFILLATTSVDDGTTIGPRAQRGVAVTIGQRIVRRGQPKLALLSEAAIDKDVLILDLTNARCLEELEASLLVTTTDHVFDNLRARLDGSHRLWVELSGIRALKAPIAIYATIVELQHAIHLIGIVLAPVAHLEGAVGTVTLGNQAIAIARLVVGEEPVGLLASSIGGHRHIRSIQHIGSTC